MEIQWSCSALRSHNWSVKPGSLCNMHHRFSSKYTQGLKTKTTLSVSSERLTLSDTEPVYAAVAATVPQCEKILIVCTKIFLDRDLQIMLKSVQCWSDIARGASVKSYRFADRLSMMWAECDDPSACSSAQMEKVRFFWTPSIDTFDSNCT